MAARIEPSPPFVPQVIDDGLSVMFGFGLHRVDGQFGLLRRLIGTVNAGEVLDRARLGLFIKALGVTLHADFQRRVDKNLDEFGCANQLARHAPLGTERRDERHQHNQAGIDEQLGGLADAADILHPVGVGETQIPVEAVADIVAIQQIGVLAVSHQALFHQIGDGGLARARQAGEPQHGRLLAFHDGAGLLVHVQRLPMNIGGAHQREIDHAGAHRGIGEAVDQDEAAAVAIILVRIERQGLGQGEIAIADFVQRQGLARQMLQIVDIDFVLQRRYRRRHRGGAQLEQILAAGQQRLIRHPQQMGRELVGDVGPRFRRRQHVAARDIYFVGQGQSDRVARHGFGKIAVMGDDAGDFRQPAGLGDGDGVAGPDATAGNGAGKAAEIQIGPIDPLHRQPERLVGQGGVDVHGLQMRKQRRALVPGRLFALLDHIDAEAGGHGNRHLAGETQFGGENIEIRHNAVEHRLIVIHQVDLVHRQHNMADAQQRRDIGMPARLDQHALARVNQDDGKIGIGRAGRHVARVLLMAGRVGDDEFAFLGGKEAVGDVDGDALLALRLQPVDQQREIDILAGGAELFGILFQGRQRVLE